VDESTRTEVLMLSVLPVVLAASLAVPSGSISKEALLTSPRRHVRTTDRYMQRLIADGVDRSPTLRALLAALETTDVIVYIEPVSELPGTVAGRLLLLPYGGTQRYLRIQIKLGAPAPNVIALMGHELRHALEVAAAPDVHTEKELIALYKRIGDRSSERLHEYDTSAARSTGRRIQRELV
jgi:hypothetical protein